MPENSTTKGVAYRYRLMQKVRWLSHEDMVSAEFGRFLDEAVRCEAMMQRTVRF